MYQTRLLPLLALAIAGCGGVDPLAIAELKPIAPGFGGSIAVYPPLNDEPGATPYIEIREIELPNDNGQGHGFYDAASCDADQAATPIILDYRSIRRSRLHNTGVFLNEEEIPTLIGKIYVIDDRPEYTSPRGAWLACGVLVAQ